MIADSYGAPVCPFCQTDEGVDDRTDGLKLVWQCIYCGICLDRHGSVVNHREGLRIMKRSKRNSTPPREEPKDAPVLGTITEVDNESSTFLW